MEKSMKTYSLCKTCVFLQFPFNSAREVEEDKNINYPHEITKTVAVPNNSSL